MYTIIPAKPFDQAKSRLASILSPVERIQLSRQLLQRTIRLAAGIGQVVVISRGKETRRLAKQAGAWALVESQTGLNRAVRQAVRWAQMRGGRTVLILPGDLPLLQASDLRELRQRAGTKEPTMVIAPCHRQDGTNALLLRPPDLIPFAYGPGSFTRHQQTARAIGIEPVIYHSPTLALDLDLPEDWDRYLWRKKCHCERPPR